MGPHGAGQENSNGMLLFTFGAKHELTITNTLFKTTWMHLRSKHYWYLIDFVITSRRNTRTYHKGNEGS